MTCKKIKKSTFYVDKSKKIVYNRMYEILGDLKSRTSNYNKKFINGMFYITKT